MRRESYREEPSETPPRAGDHVWLGLLGGFLMFLVGVACLDFFDNGLHAVIGVVLLVMVEAGIAGFLRYPRLALGLLLSFGLTTFLLVGGCFLILSMFPIKL